MSLLRIHSFCFHLGDAKELCIKQLHTIHKGCMSDIHLKTCRHSWIIVFICIPSAVWHLSHCISSMPKSAREMQKFTASWQIACCSLYVQLQSLHFHRARHPGRGRHRHRGGRCCCRQCCGRGGCGSRELTSDVSGRCLQGRMIKHQRTGKSNCTELTGDLATELHCRQRINPSLAKVISQQNDKNGWKWSKLT